MEPEGTLADGAETPFCYIRNAVLCQTPNVCQDRLGTKAHREGVETKSDAFFAGLHVSKFETGEAAAPHYDATLPGGDTAPADHNWSVRREGTNR